MSGDPAPDPAPAQDMATDERSCRHFRPTRCFLRVQLTFDPPGEQPSAQMLQAAIHEAMHSAFGSCGASLCHWSLLSAPDEKGCFFLRVRPEHLQQLRFALTLTRWRRRSRADVLAVAPSLAALACAR
ncbi:unnamed protein product [Effrenium voratum]|nr:unnamed protein product [Effrenium voratum]CAJ1415603.1 unnamed protein product [Effrenium voratum]